MLLTFGISSSLLAALLLLRMYEGKKRRFAYRFRRVLDRYAAFILALVRYVGRGVFRIMHSGVLMKVVRMVTYGTLLIVRYLEHKLVQLVQAMRRFRRSQEQRAPSLHLPDTHRVDEHDTHHA